MSRKATIDVNINGEQAKARLAEIKEDLKQIKILRDKAAAEGDVKGYNQLNGEMKKLTSEAGKLERKTPDVNNVLKNLSSASIRELQAAFNAAKKEMDMMKRSDPGFADKQKQVSMLRAELDKATGKAKEHQTTMGSLANGFNKYFGMAAALVATFTGVVFGFKKAIEEFNEFEKKVDNLSALTGLAGDELQYLTDEAKRLSTATIEGNVRITQSADAIVDAYTKVGSARPELLKNKEALNAVTQEAIILASASNSELQPAVEALTGMLNQFNAPASDSRRIINALAAGSKEGAGEIPYLTEAIEKSGTVAADAKISYESLIGIIETLAPRMKQPEMAGRSLRNIILKLQQGADETNPAIVGFSKSMENLAAKNMSATEMMNLFGVENITAAKILINNRAEMDRYTAAVTGSNVAIEQAAINTDNNSTKLEQAKNRAMLMRMELGEKLAPALTFSTNSFSYLVKGILAAIAIFKEHSGVIITTTVTIITYTAAVKLSSLWTLRATEGTILNTIVTKANTIAKGAAIMATQLWAAAQMLLAGNIAGATQAMRVFNSVLKANLFGAIAAGIMAVGTAMYFMIKKSSELTTYQKSLKTIQDKVTEQYATQAGKLDHLKAMVENNNVALVNRKKAMDELNKIVPGYNGSIDEEGRLIRGNTQALEDYLVAFEKQIQFKAASDELEELFRKKRLQDKAVDNAAAEFELTKKRSYHPDVVSGGDAGIAGQVAMYQSEISMENELNKKKRERLDTENAILQIKKEIEKSSIIAESESSIVGSNGEEDDLTKTQDAYEKLSESISLTEKQIKTLKAEGKEVPATIINDFNALVKKKKEIDDSLDKTAGKTQNEKLKKLLAQGLEIRKKLIESQINLEQEGYYKSFTQLKLAYETERDQIKNELQVNKTLTTSQKEDLNTTLLNIDMKYLKDKKKLLDADILKSMQHEKQLMQIQSESLSEGSAALFELKQKQLKNDQDIEIASLTGSEEFKQKMKLAIQAKYDRLQKNLQISQDSKTLDKRLMEETSILYSAKSRDLLILKKSYQDGKISRKEYNRKLKDLENTYALESLKIAIGLAQRKLEIANQSGEDILQAQQALDAIRLKYEQQSAQNTGKGTGTDSSGSSSGNEWEDWSAADKMNLAIDSAKQIADAEFEIKREQNQRELNEKLNTLDKQRVAELSVKGLTEKQKDDINKKYNAKEKAIQKASWAKQHKADISQAWVNLALMVGKAAINVWPIPAIPMMAAAALEGGLQIGMVSNQKNPYKSGGFTDSDLSDDTESGVTHANEFVANADATRNTSVRKVLNIIDYAQKNKTIRSINLPALMATNNGFKKGGFTGLDDRINDLSNSSGTYEMLSFQGKALALKAQELDSKVDRIGEILDSLEKNGIKGKWVLHDFNQIKDKENQAISDTM